MKIFAENKKGCKDIYKLTIKDLSKKFPNNTREQIKSFISAVEKQSKIGYQITFGNETPRRHIVNVHYYSYRSEYGCVGRAYYRAEMKFDKKNLQKTNVKHVIE